MKKHFLTLLFIGLIMPGTYHFSAAQTIVGISMVPANPTISDSITFFADCMFSSGNCAPYQIGGNFFGNDYQAYALHCLGALSFICNYTDTFKLAPLPAGNHRFIFHLDEGHGPSCTPGIVTGPTDTLSFLVTAATGINETILPASFSLTPNPSNGNMVLVLDNYVLQQSPVIEVLNVSGQLIKNILVSNNETVLHLELPSGVYWCRLKNNPSLVKKIVIVK